MGIIRLQKILVILSAFMTLNVYAPTSLSAAPLLSLSVQLSGKGAGLVSSKPGGISCGKKCKASFRRNKIVKLKAKASKGSVFAGWIPAALCPGTGDCSVKMDKKKKVKAVFSKSALLTIQKVTSDGAIGSVTSSPSGIDCGGKCKAAFPAGTSVTLSASVASQSSVFSRWLPEGACPASPVCTITLKKNTTIKAEFAKIPQTSNLQYYWHTFYGPSEAWSRVGVGGSATDTDGNIYVSGTTYSEWYGPNGEKPLNPFHKAESLFVLKLDKNGVYKWHTFYGGNGSYNEDEVNGGPIAVDKSGNIYVTGRSWAHSLDGYTWNTPTRALHTNPATCNAPFFLMKLNSEGALQWYTIYGGGGYWSSGNLALSPEGDRIVVTGTGVSFLHDAPDPVIPFKQRGIQWSPNGLAAMFNSSGGLIWHTFFGPDFTSGSPTIDAEGSVYITGSSEVGWNAETPDSDSIGLGAAPLYPFNEPKNNLTLLKLDSNGNYIWHSFFGKKSSGSSLVTDSSGDAYVIGSAWSAFTVTDGSGEHQPLHDFAGEANLVILRLASSGYYKWHTFLGNTTYGQMLTMDDASNLLAVGTNAATSYNVFWQGPNGEEPLAKAESSASMYVLKMDKNGAYAWHTFYDRKFDGARALDSENNLISAGTATWIGWIKGWKGPNGQDPITPYVSSNPEGTPHNNLIVSKFIPVY